MTQCHGAIIRCVCWHRCEESECAGGCHHLPHYEEVTVYGEGGSQRQGEEEEEELGSGGAVGQGDDKWLVDVGRCAGKCPQTEQQCIP